MDGEPSYTVYIRLPFPRGDFVDPPPVSNPSLCRNIPSPILTDVPPHQVKWDASKDESLWRILSGVAKTEIDCELSCICLVWWYCLTLNQSSTNWGSFQGSSCKSKSIRQKPTNATTFFLPVESPTHNLLFVLLKSC